MAYENVYRILASQNVAVDSAGGAVTSSAAFSSETFAILLNYPGSPSSTGGVRVMVVSPASAAVDTTGALISPNTPQMFMVTPSQRVSVISNDAGKPSLNVVELTK